MLLDFILVMSVIIGVPVSVYYLAVLVDYIKNKLNK